MGSGSINKTSWLSSTKFISPKLSPNYKCPLKCRCSLRFQTQPHHINKQRV